MVRIERLLGDEVWETMVQTETFANSNTELGGPRTVTERSRGNPTHHTTHRAFRSGEIGLPSVACGMERGEAGVSGDNRSVQIAAVCGGSRRALQSRASPSRTWGPVLGRENRQALGGN
jgi:hypothetical protein